MPFLSYSREDLNAAVTFQSELREWGLQVQRDAPTRVSNPFWREEIARRLRITDLLIVLWSGHAQASPWVEQEIRAYSGPLLVVQLDTTPWSSDQSQWEAPIVVAKSEATSVLRALLSSQTDCSGTNAPEVSCDPAKEELLGARRAEAVRAVADSHPVVRQLGRRATLLPHEEDHLAINKLDGSILRRVPMENGNVCYVAVAPVTNLQYEAFATECGFPPPGAWTRQEFSTPEQPVVSISWFEACAYAAWAGGELPTEDEWIRAATLDNPESAFATINGQIGHQFAHFGCAFASDCPTIARQFSPSPGGFYGMCGNTWDWCASNHTGHRVIKGGGYMDSARFCAVQARYRQAPLDTDCTVGFRIKVQA